MIHRPRPLVTSILAVLGAGLLITCGGDDGVTPGGGGGGGTPRVLNVSLEKSSGAPTERIRITGIPADVGDVHARVTSTGPAPSAADGAATQTSESWGFIDRTPTGDFLVVPLNPSDPLAPGSLRISITDDGDVTSNEVTLAVSALPAAPGAFDAAVAKMQQALDGWFRVNGTTRTALRAAPVASLSAEMLPLLVVHHLIDSPDNPNSMRALADGDVPLLGPGGLDRDILDRVVSAVGLFDYLGEATTLLDTLSENPGGAPLPPGYGNAHTTSRACIDPPGFDIGDCFALSTAMNRQYQMDRVLNAATTQVEQTIITGGAIVLAFTPAAGAGAALGAMIWADQKTREGLSNMMPSDFDDGETRFTPAPAWFEEDAPDPGHWGQLSVEAISKGWALDQLVLEAIMQVVGLSGGSVGNAIRPGVANKFEQDLTGFVMSEGTNTIISEASGGSSIIEVCAARWRVKCEGSVFLDGSVITGDAIAVNNPEQSYTPVRPGESGLRVETKDAFGESHTGWAENITVAGIEITITPDALSEGVDQPIDFTATVTNAKDQTLDWSATSGDIFATGPSTARLTTPGSPWSPAIVVTARSQANTGARAGKVTSDPRDGLASVVHQGAQILIDPSGACVKPNGTQPFTVVVPGVTNQAVTWSVDPPGAGSFTGNTYNAPGLAQTDIWVKATSVEQPALVGYAGVIVAPTCECYWMASISGDRSANLSGTMASFTWPSGIEFAPSADDGGPPSFLVIFGEAPVQGATQDVFLSYDESASSVWNRQDNDAPAPVVTWSVVRPGEYVEGTIQGEIHQLVSPGPPPTYRRIVVRIRFHAAEFDPMNPVAVCE